MPDTDKGQRDLALDGNFNSSWVCLDHKPDHKPSLYGLDFVYRGTVMLEGLPTILKAIISLKCLCILWHYDCSFTGNNRPQPGPEQQPCTVIVPLSNLTVGICILLASAKATSICQIGR